MAYQSLYRKYRPQRFAEVVGQAHVTTAIRNAVRDGRVGHAYLFSGPRGTGKTTMARLLAKALNCTDRAPDGDACGMCENCVGIAEGRFLDLFELDAASNNGVDAMRDLTDRVHLGLGPASAYKVYLVDEVHMLSAGASNALLKTLEEPPPHVVFALATTSPEKVLPTIRSRTQHFDFGLLSLAEITEQLAAVAEQEGLPAEREALEIIGRAAAGSMRDALSLLDQAIAHGALDAPEVRALHRGTGFEQRLEVLGAVADEDPAGVLVALGRMLDAGFDPRRVTEDLLGTARDAFLLTSGKGRVRVEAPDDHVTALGALGARTGAAWLVHVLETLGQAVVDMRGTDAADPRLVLEIALVRLARREAGPPLPALAARVDRLEQQLRDLAPGRNSVPPPAAGPAAAEPPRADARPRPVKTIGAHKRELASRVPAPESVPPPPDPPSEPSAGGAGEEVEAKDVPTVDLDEVIIAWSEVLTELPPATKAAAQEAQPIGLDGDVVTFGVPRSLLPSARPRFAKQKETIRDALAARLGRRLRFRLVEHDGFGAEPRGGRPSGSPAEAVEGTVEVDEAVEEVVEGDGDGVSAVMGPVHLAAQRLDAMIVEEIPRG